MLRRSPQRAFTLIELLVVVAVIAILAAIAIPNFLEAQTRAKVARVRVDLRTVATGLEAYRVDWNDYPPNNSLQYSTGPRELTTPIAYLTQSVLLDPFSLFLSDPSAGDLAQFYTYTKPVWFGEAQRLTALGRPQPVEAIDHPAFNLGAHERYGPWRLVSNGPDREYSSSTLYPADSPLFGADVPYDSTNGTVSWGNLLRTQKYTVEVNLP